MHLSHFTWAGGERRGGALHASAVPPASLVPPGLLCSPASLGCTDVHDDKFVYAPTCHCCSIENDLMTPSMKLKRPQLQARGGHGSKRRGALHRALR